MLHVLQVISRNQSSVAQIFVFAFRLSASLHFLWNNQPWPLLFAGWWIWWARPVMQRQSIEEILVEERVSRTLCTYNSFLHMFGSSHLPLGVRKDLQKDTGRDFGFFQDLVSRRQVRSICHTPVFFAPRRPRSENNSKHFYLLLSFMFLCNR